MTTEMTEGDITRATFWIRRWKLLGGGFEVSADSVGRTVSTIRFEDPDPKIEAQTDRAATALLNELEGNPKKKRHVFELVQNFLQAKAEAQPAVANDAGEPAVEPPNDAA